MLGRFRTKSEAGEEPGRWDVRFAPESSDSTVLKVSQDILSIIDTSQQLVTNAHVSLERRPLYESHQLIETVADRVASHVMSDDRVTKVVVTVHKPEAPIAVPFSDVAVTIERER